MASFISIHSLVNLSLVGMLFSIFITIIGKAVSDRVAHEETVVVGCCEWNHFPQNGCDLNTIEDDCRRHIARGEEVTFWKGSSMMCTESPTTKNNVCAIKPADGSNWRPKTLGWSCGSLVQKDLEKRLQQGMKKDEVALRTMSIYVDHRCWGGIYNVLDEFKHLVDAKIPLKGNDMMDLSALEVAAAWAMEDVMAKLVDDYGASAEVPLTSQGMPAAVEFGKNRFHTGRSYDGVLQFLGLGSEEDRIAALQMRQEKEEAEARRKAQERADTKEKEEAAARRKAEERAESSRRQAENDQRCNECCEEECPSDYPYCCDSVCGGGSCP